jgi:hypothetical protein
LKSALETVDKWHDKWLAYLCDPITPSDEHDKYNEYAEPKDSKQGLLEVMDIAATSISKQNNLIQKFEVEIAHLELVIAPTTHATQRTREALASTSANSQPALSAPAFVNLPSIELIDFDGNLGRWKTFWDMFVASVDNTNLSEIHKLTYLVSKLRGRARAAVGGYSMTGPNYRLVVDVLKKRFGDTNNIKTSLNMELKNLPRSGERTIDARRTCGRIEEICRQLADLQEDVEHPQVAMTIEEKLPH